MSSDGVEGGKFISIKCLSIGQDLFHIFESAWPALSEQTLHSRLRR